MVRIDSGQQYNMYVRYGSKKKTNEDSDFLAGDETTELLNASDIMLMLSGRKLGSVLDSLFPEKGQADSTILEWLDPQVSMDHMSPARFTQILEDIAQTVSSSLMSEDAKTSKNANVLKNNKLMVDFIDDLNRLSRQIKIRAKVVSPNA